MKKRIVCFLCLFLLIGLLPGCGPTQTVDPEKPVIYLYPEEETEVTVTLDFDGTLTSTYPDYGDGWTVTARPGGTLTDPATGREYSCSGRGSRMRSTTSPPASAWRGRTPRPSWRTPWTGWA